MRPEVGDFDSDQNHGQRAALVWLRVKARSEKRDAKHSRGSFRENDSYDLRRKLPVTDCSDSGAADLLGKQGADAAS